MKTYVAQNVLCDYTCGMVVVKADSLEDAIKLLKNAKDENGYERDVSKTASELRELKNNECLYVYGGG